MIDGRDQEAGQLGLQVAAGHGLRIWAARKV